MSRTSHLGKVYLTLLEGKKKRRFLQDLHKKGK